MTKNAGAFIGLRRDRIGARLLMILTCIRLSEDYGVDYRVNWFPHGADAPELDEPGELFSKDWMSEHFLDHSTFEEMSKTAMPIWTFQNDKSADGLRSHLTSGRSVIVEEGFEVLAFPWENADAIRNRYKGLINQVGFAPDLRKVMDDVDRAFDKRSVSAYHIRRGDILNADPWRHATWPAKIEPEEYYEAHLAKTAKQPAIMFSDQQELLERFQSRFPHLIKMADVADLSGMSRAKRDFLELYTMSRADQIIAPVISAFSMAAARISGRQRLVFRDVLTEEELEAANKKVIDRVSEGTDAFLNPSEAAHIYAKAAQYLNADGQSQRAFDLARPIFDAGAENAFLPVLQALNCLYLRRWDECEELAHNGLAQGHLWPEDHATLLAIRAAALGEQDKRWAAGLELSRAFWAKPLQRDVIVLASRMLYRDQLPLRMFPPIDWELQKDIRQPWFIPFNNLYLVQHLVIKRRPCNFDMILLDWHELALDRKSQRLLQDQERLTKLREHLGRFQRIDTDAPAYRSFDAMLSFYQGTLPLEKAIDAMRRIVSEVPDRPLYHKRLGDLLEAAGDVTRARFAHADALAHSADNPFVAFCLGRFLERSGYAEQGQNQIIRSADMSPQCATIFGEAGQIMLRRKDYERASFYLTRASELCPSYKRFRNQLIRAIERKQD